MQHVTVCVCFYLNQYDDKTFYHYRGQTLALINLNLNKDTIKKTNRQDDNSYKLLLQLSFIYLYYHWLSHLLSKLLVHVRMGVTCLEWGS